MSLNHIAGETLIGLCVWCAHTLEGACLGGHFRTSVQTFPA